MADDEDAAAAAFRAMQERLRLRRVLTEALEHFTSYVLAQDLAEDDEVQNRFAEHLHNVLEDLDADERVDALVLLLEPLAERRAAALNEEMQRRLASVPEVPDAQG